MMEKFGFKLSPSARIDLDNIDREKFVQLVQIEPDVLKCMACGSCTASCTAGKFTPTSVRSAILEIQNGRWQQALDMLKGCLLCGKCTMVCPRAINTRHLILAINEVYQSGK